MSVIESVRQILEEYEIGEPWKLTKGAGFVVPILGRPPFPDRNYVLLQEVLDQVEFKDTGSISGVDVSNRSGNNVFLRKGTMLKGVGTQSRSPVAGVVLEPLDETIKVPVNCIHASHGIRAGAAFMAMGVAPHSVYEDLGQQSRTWASISNYSARASTGVMRAGGRSAARAMTRMSLDALVDVEESVGKFREDVDDILSQIPGDHVNQVGVAVFDLQGVAGVEVFDHPDSWRAFSKSIIRSYSELLSEEVSDIYEIKMDKADPALRAFLKKACDAERSLVTENKVSRIWALSAEGVDGELAEIEGREIHLVLSRSTKRKQPQTPQIDQLIDQLRVERDQSLRNLDLEWQEALQGQGARDKRNEARLINRVDALTRIMMPSPEWYRRQGSTDLLQRLDEQPLRFTELLSSMDVSRGTLGSRIREAKDMGFINKTKRDDNGYTAWKLTALGKELCRLRG